MSLPPGAGMTEPVQRIVAAAQLPCRRTPLLYTRVLLPRVNLQAVKMTLALTAVATPINALFGIRAALFLARNDFPGKPLAISILDLPFSISPVITGAMLGCGACSSINIMPVVRRRGVSRGNGS